MPNKLLTGVIVVLIATCVVGVVMFSRLHQPAPEKVETLDKPTLYGQYKAEEIPQTGVDTFQSLPSNNYFVSMRRGRCNTMYLHLQGLKKYQLDSNDYLHARQAIALLAREMLNDYIAEPGLRNDSRANEKVWSDTDGFAKSRENLLTVMAKQMQQRKQGKSIKKQDEIKQIYDACQSCHTNYTINKGVRLKDF